jgi:hypothetical protein
VVINEAKAIMRCTIYVNPLAAGCHGPRELLK